MSASGRGATVVLVHGLGRTRYSMKRLERVLLGRGYRVDNWGYPSRLEPLAALIGRLRDHLAAELAGAPAVHFVGHSLGGLVIRGALAEPPPCRVGRIVMVATPNRGVRIVDRMKLNLLFRWLFGPAIDDLGTAADGALRNLPVPAAEIGVIAGARSFHPVNPSSYLNLFWFPGARHDGTVEIESTRLPGMADFLVLDAHHTFIMNDPETIRQAIEFIDRGRFDHGGPEAAESPSP